MRTAVYDAPIVYTAAPEVAEAAPARDVTARKVHQTAILLLTVGALARGGAGGALLSALAGAVMLVGRFWWPADVFRQFVWKVAEPRGWLTARPVAEDIETRRVARVLGGAGLLGIAAALATGRRPAALGLGLPLGGMILADAVANVCALCLVRYQARLWRYRILGT